MEENQSSNYGSTTNTGTSASKPFREQTPDEVKENVKEKVAKGVAAVAGALKGFTEEAKKDDLAGSTKQAIQKAGETTRELSSTAKDEYRNTKETLKGGSSPSTGGSSLGKSDASSPGSSPESLSGSLGSSSIASGAGSTLGTSQGMGGSELGTGTSTMTTGLGETSSRKSELDEEER